MAKTTFEIPRKKRRDSLIGGGVALVAAVAAAAFAISLPTWGRAWGPAVLALVLAGIAATALQYAIRPERFTVIVSDEAIQIGDRVVPWSDIDGVRATTTLLERRIDLLHGGKRIAAVNHHLDGLPELIDIVLRKASLAPSSSSTSVGRPNPRLDVAMNAAFLLLMAVVFVFVALDGNAAVGWGGLLFVVFLFATDFRLALLRIDFDDDAMRLRYRLGRRVVERKQIRAFELVVLPNDLYVIAKTKDEPIKLKIAGIDPFLILETARRAYPRLVA